MESLFLILIPIVITDLINPVLFAACIFCLGTQRPFYNTSFMLLSFFLTYFLAGIILAVGFEEITEYLQNPTTIDYVLECIIALLLLWFAWYIRKTADYQHEPKLKHPKEMTLSSSLFMGTQVNLVGLPFALPYFVAIDRILIANLSELTSIVVLLIYNIAYIAPFTLMLWVRWIYQKESDAIFQKINVKMLKISDVVLPIILVIIAIVMLYDSLSYFLL